VERTGYLRLIWASKSLLLVFAVAAAIVVYLVSSSEADQYESKALGQIVSAGQAEGEILTEEQLLSLSNLFSELAKTSSVLELAHEEEAVKGRAGEFNASVGIEPQARVGVLGFTSTTGDPEESAAFANAYANGFAKYLNELQVDQRKTSLVPIQTRINEINAELAELSTASPDYAGLQVELQSLQDQIAAQSANPGDTLRVIEPAVATSTPVSPKPTRNAILAFIGALLLGTLIVYLRDLVFDRYRSPEEAARDLGLPLLGEIPRGNGTPALEAFRTLRTALMLSLEQSIRSTLNGPGRRANDGATILITGAESGCGKSYVTSNFVRTLAAEGRRVAVVDGDLRRPTLNTVFGVPLSPGLSDLLVSEQAPPVQQITTEVHSGAANGSPGTLRVLPAGAHAESAVEWLSSARMQTVVEELRAEDDVVVFDSPPTLVVVDPVVLARYAEGVLFVVDSRKTRRRDARRAVEALRAIGAPLLGVAFNRSNTKQSRYDSYRPRELRRQSWQPKETKV
jgi:capsular exopolysaccharide synthesis family protein